MLEKHCSPAPPQLCPCLAMALLVLSPPHRQTLDLPGGPHGISNPATVPRSDPSLKTFLVSNNSQEIWTLG